MSTNAFPISTPVKFVGSGSAYFLNSGDITASNAGLVNFNPSGAITLNSSTANISLLSATSITADAVSNVTITATGALTLIGNSATSDITFSAGRNISHSAVGYNDFNAGSIRNFVVSTTGALITTADGITLSPLTIGTSGQVLTVNGSGMPIWQTPAGNASGTFNVNLTGSTTAAASAAFTTLTATWDESVVPDYDDGIFDSGVFTAASDGIYDISASIIFSGNNSGAGVTFTDAPTQGEAVRQLRIRNTSTNKTLAFATRQAEPYAGNDTHVQISGIKVKLTSGNTIAFQYRHDASASLTIRGSTDGDTLGQTWFGVHRVR